MLNVDRLFIMAPMLQDPSQKSRIEDAYQDLINRQEDSYSDVFVIHRNVIYYFLSRLFHLPLYRLISIRVPYCSVIEVKKNDLKEKSFTLCVKYVL